MSDTNVINWTSDNVREWAKRKHLNSCVLFCISQEDVDGKCLLSLTENDVHDLRNKYKYDLKVGDIKRFWIAIRTVQKDNYANLVGMGAADICLSSSLPSSLIQHNFHHGILSSASSLASTTSSLPHQPSSINQHYQQYPCEVMHRLSHDIDRVSPSSSVDGRTRSIQPEFFKTMISLGRF